MKIEFQMVDEKLIKIIGVDEEGEGHEIGQIYTPAGTSHDALNAIQICGFTEAYDLWGCACYQKPKLEGGIEMTNKAEQVRDIQLKFNIETIKKEIESIECHRCFNNPCTCESKVRYSNPYTVKRDQDLILQRIKKKDKGVKLEY